jgi:2-dehydropantoate 2-reductase
MIWHLLGAGAMGSLAASYLQSAGFTVEALDVGHHEPGKDGLLRQLKFPGDDIWREIRLPWARAGVIDHLLLATKAGNTQEALSPWLPLLAPNVTLVNLQNGMGQLDGVGLPDAVCVVSAVTTSAAWRDGIRITVVAENITVMGDGGVSPPDWFASLAQAWPKLKWCQSIRARQLEKLAINAVINPLTACHRCKNGALLSSTYQPEMRDLSKEIDKVLTAVDDNWPNDTLARATDIAKRTAENTSSMLADVLANRPTEIAFINGWLVREAQKRGIAAPLNAALVARL